MIEVSAPVVLALLLSGCAVYGATSGRVVLKDDQRVIDVSVSSYDRTVITRFYETSMRRGLPPGLAKRGGNLPPGLAKGDRLPRGLHVDPLPYELEAKLSVLPGDYIRVRIGGDIVLMNRDSRVVYDVLYGVAK